MLAYWGDNDPRAANIVAVPIIQQGLAEMAKTLVGGEAWVIRDSLEAVEESALRWVLDIERGLSGERVQELKYVGLQSYLAECEGCDSREETFTLQPDREDGMIRFMSKCGQLVSF